MLPGEDAEPLYVLDRVEMWDAVRRCIPGLSFEEFEAKWDAFQAEKAEYEWRMQLH